VRGGLVGRVNRFGYCEEVLFMAGSLHLIVFDSLGFPGPSFYFIFSLVLYIFLFFFSPLLYSHSYR